MAKTDDEAAPTCFAHRSSGFVEWFSNCPGTRLSPKIQITDLRHLGAGRGVVALEGIEPDEELFAIPHNIVLTISTSSIPPNVLDPLKDNGPWPSLIVTILFEYFKGKDSFWYPYFRVLPTAFDTLMFWADAELAELQASAVFKKIGKASAEESWRRNIIPTMLNHPELFPADGSTEEEKIKHLIRLAHFAGSLIMAYAFDIDRDEEQRASGGSGSDEDFEEDDEDEPLKGMVPFADMLNADADHNNARLFQEEDFLIMKATKAINAGEQIFNDYGALPRSDLLRMYGYVTDQYAQYDVVEIEHGLLVEVAGMREADKNTAWLKREEQLDEIGIIDDGYSFPRPPEGIRLEQYLPGNIHMLLRGLCLDPSTMKLPKMNSQESLSIQEAALLSTVTTKKLSEYPTYLQQDMLELRSNDGPEAYPKTRRHEMALKVRIGEKEILHAIISLCEAHIKEKTSDIAENDKKRKYDNGRSTAPRKSAKRGS